MQVFEITQRVVVGLALVAGATAPAAQDAGAVLDWHKLSNAAPGFPDLLNPFDGFAISTVALEPATGGPVRIAVGAPNFTESSVWVLSMATDGTVEVETQIGSEMGGFGGTLNSIDGFGSALGAPGDLDGDGVDDLIVGAPGDGEGGTYGFAVGALWVLFLNADGTVRTEQKISALQGGFGGAIDDSHTFGHSVAPLGDLDGDGVVDLIVGAPGDGDGGGPYPFLIGACWVLFMNADGTVKAEQKISATQGGFGGTLVDGDRFGVSVAGLGDVDGDGVADAAVGFPGNVAGSSEPFPFQVGGLWVLLLNANGTVKSEQRIDLSAGGFTGSLSSSDGFGTGLAAPGDLDGNGVPDVVVGAPGDPDGTSAMFAQRGALWVLYLDATGAVIGHQKISETQGGFGGTLDDSSYFGGAVAALGDLDGDAQPDLLAGNAYPGELGFFGPADGRLWTLFLAANETVAGEQEVSDKAGGMEGTLDPNDLFGSSLASLGDLNGDGDPDLAIGAPGTLGASFAFSQGSVWVLGVDAAGDVQAYDEIGEGIGGFSGDLEPGDLFGTALASLGDLDGLGGLDLAVGSPGGDLGVGELWVLSLDSSGTVVNETNVSATAGGFGGVIETGDQFGAALAWLGDLNGDGFEDLAVGAPQGGGNGAVFVLFLNADGTVASDVRIAGPGVTGDAYGTSLGVIGKLDADEPIELGVGSPSASDPGKFWIAFLSSDGSALSHRLITEGESGFGGELDDFDRFGSAVLSVGDPDRDGVTRVYVGAPRDDDGGTEHGAAWGLDLERDPWFELGGGLPGLFGVTPVLDGTGSLAVGSTVTFSLTNAYPNSVAIFVLGFSAVNLPFLGGALIPSPDFTFAELVTDFSGAADLTVNWPSVFTPDTTLYEQFWVFDPVAVESFSASNGLGSNTP